MVIPEPEPLPTTLPLKPSCESARTRAGGMVRNSVPMTQSAFALITLFAWGSKSVGAGTDIGSLTTGSQPSALIRGLLREERGDRVVVLVLQRRDAGRGPEERDLVLIGVLNDRVCDRAHRKA